MVSDARKQCQEAYLFDNASKLIRRWSIYRITQPIIQCTTAYFPAFFTSSCVARYAVVNGAANLILLAQRTDASRSFNPKSPPQVHIFVKFSSKTAMKPESCNRNAVFGTISARHASFTLYGSIESLNKTSQSGDQQASITLFPGLTGMENVADFRFINYTKPNENLEEANRHQIRSQVRRFCHAKQRATKSKRHNRSALVPLRPTPARCEIKKHQSQRLIHIRNIPLYELPGKPVIGDACSHHAGNEAKANSVTNVLYKLSSNPGL